MPHSACFHQLCLPNLLLLCRQVIHKPTAYTLVSASSFEKGLRQNLASTSDKIAAATVGQAIGQRLKEQSVGAVAFEMKPGEKYHGKLRALLDALNDAGVKLI